MDDSVFSIYFIAGTQDVKNGSLPDLLEEALQAGVTCFQYREKGEGALTDPREIKKMAQKCQTLCQAYHVPFIINDDVFLAEEIQADGIHVGQSDLAIEEVFRQFTGKIVGLSCHDLSDVLQGNNESAISYYGIGPVFATTSKKDAEKPIGIKKLHQLAEVSTKPVVAIGGISEKNAQKIFSNSSISGVSVISAITKSNEISKTVQQLKPI